MAGALSELRPAESLNESCAGMRLWSAPLNDRELDTPPRRASAPCAQARYLFSASRFHVPQGRSKIAQRFIAGLCANMKRVPPGTKERTRSSPVISVAPPAF